MFCSIEEEEEERRGGASGRPRTHLPPTEGNTLDPPRLPLCQPVHLCVLFRPRSSLYGHFGNRAVESYKPSGVKKEKEKVTKAEPN